MDVRTLFLAQTFALIAIAAMLWVARNKEADRHNGQQTWMLAVMAQGLAYLLLANAGRLPVLLTGVLGNLFGSLGVALFFVAIRQFLGLGYRIAPLAVMVGLVTATGAAAGTRYAEATIFNGFVYGLIQLLNGLALWRRPAADLLPVQRTVAASYLLMALVLPARAIGLLAEGRQIDYLNIPITWQLPLFVFGFLFLIITNLGFMLMCKMRAESEVRHMAMTDGLTGLANRRALDAAIKRTLAAAVRGQRPFAVLMVDLDHFKAVNDQFGHHQGDAILAAFALRLGDGLRGQDECFRYGGEEFCVLLPDTAGEAALSLAERLRQHVALPAAEGKPALTVSVGIAVWRPTDNATALFARADRALYKAKNMGRDRVELGNEA